MFIRIATSDDAPVLAALNAHVHQLHAEAEPWYFKPPVGEDYFAGRAREFRELVTNAEHTVFVAVAPDGALAGYVWTQRRDTPETAEVYACKRLYINHISVHPNYRRQGAGAALMAAAKALAHERAANMTLGVHAFNLTAQRFFARHGFVPLIHTLWHQR